MWYYKSSIGVIKIYFNAATNNYALSIDDEVYGFYASPNSAAGDVYTHTTGCYEWDVSEELSPETVNEWKFIND